MTTLEHLRLALALTRTVRGAHLRMTTDDRVLTVGCHPTADLDPAVLRALLRRRGGGDHPDLLGAVRSLDVGGALEDLGGGLYRRRSEGIEERWFATLVAPEVVASLVCRPRRDAAGDVPRLGLHPDGCLGVTVVRLTVEDPDLAHLLDPTAAALVASCLVEELLSDVDVTKVTQPVRSDHDTTGEGPASSTG